MSYEVVHLALVQPIPFFNMVQTESSMNAVELLGENLRLLYSPLDGGFYFEARHGDERIVSETFDTREQAMDGLDPEVAEEFAHERHERGPEGDNAIHDDRQSRGHEGKARGGILLEVLHLIVHRSEVQAPDPERFRWVERAVRVVVVMMAAVIMR